MRTVGIIGGLGPETSAKFYLEIVNLCMKNEIKQRPPILVWNTPIPIDIEEELLINNTGEKKYLPFLIEAAITLEKAGANFLVMPCNTMHIFIEQIRNAVNIPVLSIVDETISVIKKGEITKVAILATTTTINKKLFQNKLDAIGVKEIIPNKEQQKKLNRMIHNLVIGKHNLDDKIEIGQIISEIKKCGARNIILACTDLQLIIEEMPDIKIFDTMKVLAEATTNEINKNLSV